MVLDAPLPLPGWYADPVGPPGTLRWWDGRAWSSWVHFVGVAPPPPLGRQAYDARSTPYAPVASGAPPVSGAPPAGAATPWRIPARAAWWGLLGLVLGEVLAGLLVIGGSALSGSISSAPVTLAGEIGLWAGMLGSCLFVSRRYGTGSLRHDFHARLRVVDLGWGPLVTIAGLVATAALSPMFAGSRLSGSNTQVINGHRHSTAGFALIAVIVSVGAPVFEELFFRGLIRTALAARLGSLGAVFAQAGLFALAHVNPVTGLGNVEVVVVIGAFGVILGLAAHLTGRLGAGVIGHGLYNLLVTVVLLAS